METKIKEDEYVYIDTINANFSSSLKLEVEFKLYVLGIDNNDNYFLYKLFTTAKNVGTTTVNFSNKNISTTFRVNGALSLSTTFRRGSIAPNETITVSAYSSKQIPLNQNVVLRSFVGDGTLEFYNEKTFYFVAYKPIYYNGIAVNNVYYNGTQANSITYNGTPL